MSYDIHPIIVHFPIALLFLYSIIKIIPFSRWFPRIAWKDMERVLLVVGLLGAFAALVTGNIAEELNRPNHDLVEWHSTFAALTTWLYGALLVGELAAIVNMRFAVRFSGTFLGTMFTKTSRFLELMLTHKVFSRLIALAALVSLALTGMLGGVLVYGTTADPLAGIVLRLLGIDL